MNELDLIQKGIEAICEEMQIEPSGNMIKLAANFRWDELPFVLFFSANYQPAIQKITKKQVYDKFRALTGTTKPDSLLLSITQRMKQC